MEKVEEKPGKVTSGLTQHVTNLATTGLFESMSEYLQAFLSSLTSQHH